MIDRAVGRDRWEKAAYSVKLAAEKLIEALLYKFDPNQPRDEIGRWTDTGENESPAGPMKIAARRSRALEAICLAQYAKDVFHCRMVGLRSCYAQATLRYANCLACKPIPPLNY